ncbi:hypothetical protein TCAL_02649 [Tigriopus californicus]|uniref:Uncharacterized protein n=1 Tax=Tigriopus californicus TaxID=6832 RepID=A0A553NDA6_TIGCA|nr:hypothetical protein TCAL_02649 [Tigriopus californicus]
MTTVSPYPWRAQGPSLGNHRLSHPPGTWQLAWVHPLQVQEAKNQGSSLPKEFKPTQTIIKKPVQAEKPPRAAFIDPLTAMMASPEDEDALGCVSIPADDEMDGVKSAESRDADWSKSELEALWTQLGQSAMTYHDSTRLLIPETLHYILDKLNFDDESTSRNARLDMLEGRQTRRSNPEKNGLTPKQFGDFLDLVTHQLSNYWTEDKRVQVLRLVIQIAKILGDMDKSGLSGYPAFFFQITEVLVFFGRLVYDRIASKCPGLRMNFTSHDATPQAQEMCKNWLLKIMSIRELVPRLYLEIAFMRCFRFIDDPEYFYKTVLDRLTKSIRGLSDPIAACYLRAFLVRSAFQASSSSHTSHLVSIKRQAWDCLPRRICDCIRRLFNGFSKPNFLGKMLGTKKSLNAVDTDKCPAFVYEHIFAVLSPSLIEGQVSHVSHVVANCAQDPSYSVENLICVFGKVLTNCYSLTRTEKLNVLNTIWHCVMDIHDLHAYLKCALVWTEFAVKQLQPKEINTLLGNIVSQTNSTLSRDGTKSSSDQLPKIVQSLLSSQDSLERTLTLSNFLPLFNTMSKGSQIEMAKILVERAIKDVQEISDPVLSNVLIHLCDILGDSINALSIQDETRQISAFICHVIRKVKFEDDFEQQLKFLTDCRGKYSHLTAVQLQLIHSVHLLAIHTLERANGKISTRIKGFLQACCAFVFITIPSIDPRLTQVQLCIEAAEVCLMCRCFGQAESSLKVLFKTLGELGQAHEANRDLRERKELECTLLGLCSQLFSLLLVVPDNVEHGILYMIRGALNAINRFPWSLHSAHRAELNIRALQLLSVVTWDDYPYHIEGLDSNDVLYGSNPKFVDEVNQISGTVLGQVLDQIQDLTSNGFKKESGRLSWQLLQTCYGFVDLESSEKLVKLAQKLWSLSKKQNELQPQTDRLLQEVKLRKDERATMWKRVLL